MSSRRGKIRENAYLMNVVGIAVFVALWWLAVEARLISPLFVASPLAVVQVLFTQTASLAQNTYITLVTLVESFLVAAAVGILAGAVTGAFDVADWVISPILDLLRSVPNVAWVPLAIVWFGIVVESQIFVSAFSAFFPIFTNTYVGFKSVRPSFIRAGYNLGASDRDVFFRIRLPASLGQIFPGLKLGIQNGMAGLIAIEFLDSTSGLGFMMGEASDFFKANIVIMDMLMIGLLGFALTMTLVLAERRFLGWQRRTS